MLYPWDYVGQKGIRLKDGQVVDVVRIIAFVFMQGQLPDGSLIQFDYRDIIPDPLSQPDRPLD